MIKYKLTGIFYLFLRAIFAAVLMLAATQLLYGLGSVFAAAVLTATKTDALQTDADSSGGVTPGDTLRYTVTIQNSNATDVTNSVFNDTIDTNTTFVTGSLQTTPLARNDSYSTVGNVQLTIPVGSGVLLNDSDPDGSGGLTVSAFDATSANGGNVGVGVNGNFTYNPPAGFSGTDTFTYTVNDGESNTNTAIVSITVGQVVWFIDNNAGGPGDGRFTSPFNSIANFNSLAADDPGDYIFVYQGTSAYSSALTLLNNQQLIGQGDGLTISPNLSIATTLARPKISNVTLASGNTVHGVNLQVSSGTAISGASVGSLTINNVFVTNGSGAGVSLSNGALAVTFDGVSSNGGTNGVGLTNVTGSFAINGGTIQNATNNGIDIAGSSGTLTAFTLKNSTISNNASTGLRASIQGTGSIGKIDIGNNTFSGNPYGVDLATNDTASLKFDIHNNTMNGQRTQANIAANDATHNNGVGPTMEGYIRNNAITTSPTSSVYIALWVVSDGDGNITVDINNNNIANFGDSGIDVESRGGTGDVNARIANNTASTTATFPLAGMFLRSGNGTPSETSLLCVNVSANNVNAGAGAVADYYLDRGTPATTLFQIQGLSPTPATAAQAVAYLTTTDSTPPATGDTVGGGTYTAATCGTVSFASVPNSQLAQESNGVNSVSILPNLGNSFTALKENAVNLMGNFLSSFGVSTAYAAPITSVSLGTLNPSETITITFDVTVNDPLNPTNTAQVCNQGNVTADGGLNTLTNDPDTVASNDATCTAIQPGVITIIKDAQPNDAQDFSFVGSSSIGTFSLDDDADGTLPNQQIFTLAAGTYNIKESSVSGWDLTNLVCITNDNSQPVSTSGSTAQINLDNGENVTCTFTNTKQGTITVNKVANPKSNDNFTIAVGGDTESEVTLDDAFPDDNDGIGNSKTLSFAPGTYTLIESIPSGWNLASLICSSDTNQPVSVSTNLATITLHSGENITCTFTNTKQQGSITIVKDAQPNDAQDFGFVGSNSIGTFSLDDDTDATLPNQQTFTVGTGIYNIKAP